MAKAASKYSKRVELAGALLRRFGGRDDRVAVSTGTGFAPEELAAPVAPRRLAAEHLTDDRCLAFYIMRPDNTVTLSCLDFDNKVERPDSEIETKVAAVVGCLREHGIEPLVERSQSGRGVHVWIFLDKPTVAWVVRSFWRGVVEQVGISLPEIYPRQDELSGKGIGNPIRYPLYGRSCFVDVARDWQPLEPMWALNAIRPVSLDDLENAATAMGFELAKPKPVTKVTIEVAAIGSTIPERVQELLRIEPALAKRWAGVTAGMVDTSKSALMMSLACLLIRAHVPTGDIATSLDVWCRTNGYQKGLEHGRVMKAVESAYCFVWRCDDEVRRLSASEAEAASTDNLGNRKPKPARRQSNKERKVKYE